MNTASKQPRIAELDALRGLAALAVVGFHYTTRYDQLFGHTDSPVLGLDRGHYGVDLFFMLSGFVILMSLERSTGWMRFAWGRATRLYPAYWAAVAMTFAVVSLVGLPGQEVSLGDALINLTMIQSLLGASHVDGAYWSLQAELIFYFNMLVLHRLGAWKRPVTTVALWVAAAAIVEAAIMITASNAPPIASLLTKLRTVASLEFIPLFGIGVLLHALLREGRTRALLPALASCLAVQAWFISVDAALVDGLLAAVLAAAVSGRAAWLAAGPLVWLGAVSYPLYLTHQNLGYVLIGRLEAIGLDPTVSIAVTTCAALVLAWLLHEVVEKPALASLRHATPERILSRRPRRTASAAVALE